MNYIHGVTPVILFGVFLIPQTICSKRNEKAGSHTRPRLDSGL